MDIVIGLIVFIAGTFAGFFANRFLSASNQEQQKLAEQASESEAALVQYKLDVAEHLDSSTRLLEQMNSTCKTAMSQMEQSTKLLQQATPANDAMPFFSKETQEQLAQTVNLRHDKRKSNHQEAVTEPPLDYSGNPSGLFDDSKQSVTTAK
ncbi:MAG: YhcB family protein [Colwellia sp.]|nr:YhcB family protein [Colwellia sp.]